MTRKNYKDTIHNEKVTKASNPRTAQLGAGDNYGLGYKAKVGKIRGDTVGYIPVSAKGLKMPPKSTV